ncbi:protein kinase [Streptomyces sp. HUCO-GS316]|uniref:protein kinase domain-containing protein n=1 Tax=Streptomyces sp. HUCO-GS316 TaxID=2692198 RepID=UPI001370B7C4|nr:protein kinase [Streptomyces sp. HUCO-GS316]
MTQQRPVPPDPARNEAAVLRQTGAAPLGPRDPGRIGPYVPLALLGSGGMGRVYLARPADAGPGLVAVKVIRPEYADDPGFRRRFEREASVHARVRTRHMPELRGTGFDDDLLWMATEYLPGLDLADAVREDGGLGTVAIWRLVGDLGRALADLAAAGIVHRDLKPSNVLLSVRGTYVIDFGLSLAVDSSALTGTGNRVGTPAYMSPEHLRTGRCDPASDVFSLAGTLIYATTGHAPFGDGTGVDVMHRVAFEEPDPELIGRISAKDTELGSLLSACLAKEPERRPAPQDLIDAAADRATASGWPEPLGGRVLARQRAYEMLGRLPVAPAARLRPPGDGPKAVRPVPPEPVRAVPALPPESLSRSRRKPVLAVATGVTLCALAAGVFVLTRQDAPASASSPGPRPATGRAVPGDAARSPTPGASDATTLSGKSADGAASTDGALSPPEVSRSADAHSGRRGASSPPVVETGAPAPSPPADDSAPTGPSAPPWISDCTYYSGNGRTSQGDSGRRVLQLQCILTQRGYDAGSTDPDGEFGPGTESAVRSFQSAKGLETDGIVDHGTWTALRATE